MGALQQAFEAKMETARTDEEIASLQEAYDHLSVPSQRLAYDRKLSEASRDFDSSNTHSREIETPEVTVSKEHKRLFDKFGRQGFSSSFDEGSVSHPQKGRQALPANPMSDNAYERLGLPVDATERDIRAARKAAVLKYHADREGGNAGVGSKSHEFTARINDAVDQLLDPAKRSKVPAPDAKIESKSKRSQGVFSDGANGESIRARLKNLAGENRPFTGFIMAALDWSVGIERKGFRVIPEAPHIDPDNSELISFILETKDQVLLTALIHNALDKSWSTKTNQGKSLSLLKQIINLENRVINNFLSEMIVAPWWINARGAEILSMLLDRGHYFQVARALHLGGFLDAAQNGRRPTWVSHPKGVELMMRVLGEADEFSLWQIDNAFFGQSAVAGVFFPHKDLGWPAALGKVDARISRAPYVSGHSLRALGIVKDEAEDVTLEAHCDRLLLAKLSNSRNSSKTRP